jgi:penicillin-insensitive murein endopeptidase
MARFGRLAPLAALLVLGLGTAGLIEGVAAAAEPLAKTLFGAKDLPALAAPQSFGFYSKGCFAGGVAIAPDGPHWQVMRLSRNRRWGHPAMIALIEKLSRKAAEDGWNGLLIGDISQPRGGPMVTGHASHQLGLDADIWFTPMPAQRLTEAERENVSAVSMLKGDSLYVDDRKWTPAHTAVLRDAAQFPDVERIFVHPGIKKKLCDTVTGDRSWLHKLRPYWGHESHFHVRISCQPGSPGCQPQHAVAKGDGCDKSLDWWFTEEPWRPAKGPQKPRARDVLTMANLPRECRSVLDAPAPQSVAQVTVGGPGADISIVGVPAVRASAFAPLPTAGIPLPTPRPAK